MEISKIRKQAKESFAKYSKDFTIKEETNNPPYRSFWIQREKSYTYSFRLVTYPGSLIIDGDMGFWCWKRCNDMFEFVRGAFEEDSLGYISEKVPNNIKIRNFCSEKADQFLKELPNELKEYGLEINESDIEDIEYISTDDCNEQTFCERLYGLNVFNNLDFGEWVSYDYFTEYDYCYLWCIEAAKWVVREVDKGNFEKLLKV